MNELETPRKSFSLRRPMLWIVGVPGVAFLIVALTVYGHVESRSAGRLAAVLAKLDDTDPGWRLEALEASRIEVRDRDNSAVLCRELAHLLGPIWPDSKLEDRLRPVPIGELPDEVQKVILEDEMTRLKTVRDLARHMVALPRGRHEIEHPANPLATRLFHQLDVRKVAKLFEYERRYRAERGDVSEAVRAGRGAVCAGRSLYDEPTMLAQVIRASVIGGALAGVERSLALGESGEGELRALDALLADEARHDTLLLARRAERAMWYRLYAGVASGQFPPEEVESLVGSGEKESWLQAFLEKERRAYRRRLPKVMAELTRAVEIAQLPSQEQGAEEDALLAEADEADAPHLAGVKKIGEGCRRKSAYVAAMRGLIAAERYRMKYGKWPAKFSDVVPEFLEAVPADPFNGKPLVMKRLADGVVVYSVGPNRVDDGGRLPREHPGAEDVDTGFRLWDVAQRRRPASPPNPQEDVP